MPHVSKQTIPLSTQERLDEHIAAFLGETSIKDRIRIFQELFTKTERVMMGKRLALIFLVGKDMPTYTISETLRMSPSTIDRFKAKMERGAFKYTATWLSQEKIRNALVEILSYALPFKRRKTLSQSLDEN